MKRTHRSIVLCALGLLATGVSAQTRYVSDELVITFRTGPSTQNAIQRNLTSGQRVEVLEERADSGFSRVRLPDGAEGWVLTQYLQNEPTSGLQLAAAQREAETMRARAETLQQEVADLQQRLTETNGLLNETQSSADKMSSELTEIRSASASALETRDQNENLRRRLAQLTSEAEITGMELDDLRRRERQNWFIVGAAVLFGGIVIGLVAPSLRPKRRSSW